LKKQSVNTRRATAYSVWPTLADEGKKRMAIKYYGRAISLNPTVSTPKGFERVDGR